VTLSRHPMRRVGVPKEIGDKTRGPSSPRLFRTYSSKLARQE
jgi:hypothetical protein